MTGSNKTKRTSSANDLTKSASVELSEAALGAASGGATIYMNQASIKLDTANKASTPSLPAAKLIG